MQVSTKGQRLPFYQNRTEKTPQCPAEVDRCQLKSFLVPGDLVLVGPAMDDFGCAHFIAPNARVVKERFKETIGFVPLSELKEIRRLATPGPDWHGTWRRSAEAEITIAPETGGKLKVQGSATFGALDPERMRRGAVNVGELEGTVAPPRSNMIALGDGWDGIKRWAMIAANAVRGSASSRPISSSRTTAVAAATMSVSRRLHPAAGICAPLIPRSGLQP